MNEPFKKVPLFKDRSVKPPKKADRVFYGHTHRNMREQLLKRFPLCQRCAVNWSEVAHHLRYPARSLNDYEALCEECHKKEHNQRLAVNWINPDKDRVYPARSIEEYEALCESCHTQHQIGQSEQEPTT